MNLFPRKLIKTYHTQFDVKEYYVDTVHRVIIVTHLHNGNQYESVENVNEFLEKNKGTEIATLISYHVWPV